MTRTVYVPLDSRGPLLPLLQLEPLRVTLKLCSKFAAAVDSPLKTSTVTSASSPVALPAPPWNSTSDDLSFSPAFGPVTLGTGPAVSTLKEAVPVLATLPVWSDCSARTVWVPSLRCAEVSVQLPPITEASPAGLPSTKT